MFCLSIIFLLLGQKSVAADDLACWNHYCELDYKQGNVLSTERKFCFRPHYKCVYSVDDEDVANANCEQNTGTAPLPDIYCASSFLRDCRCGYRGIDADVFYDPEPLQAFCDCKLSVVGNLISTCIFVPVVLLIVIVCFLKVFGGCLENLVGSFCGRGKNQD